MGYALRKKITKKKWPLTILYDDREKNPWVLKSMYFKMKRQRLITGDYTIDGYTSRVAVEKKSGLHELVQNISGIDRKRFKSTLERLSKFEHKYFVIDGTLDDIDLVLKKLPSKTRIDKVSVCHWLTLISVKYGIPVIFLGNKNSTRKLILEKLFVHIANEL